jgi:anti-sigma regulatory factor (Ser/Thr protein kinase)
MLADWLAVLCWPDVDCIDLMLAVSEAIANVVDHAYPSHDLVGRAHLFAWETIEHGQRRIVMVVTDAGQWKLAPADPGFRGRGLLMMRYCMASVHIEPTPRGTTVIMTSRPVRTIPHSSTVAPAAVS